MQQQRSRKTTEDKILQRKIFRCIIVATNTTNTMNTTNTLLQSGSLRETQDIRDIQNTRDAQKTKGACVEKTLLVRAD